MQSGTVGTLALCAVLAAGCGADPAGGQAAAAQQRFARALAAGDTATACALLAPDVRCPRRGEVPTGGRVREVQVWGTQAQVVTAADTVFLTRSRQGWRVLAAGCRPRGELPYACALGAAG